MSEQRPSSGSRKPTTRERLRPAEMLGLAVACALFAGIIVILTTRQWPLAGIVFGVAFIVALVLLALFGLTIKPNDFETRDIDEQNRGE